MFYYGKYLSNLFVFWSTFIPQCVRLLALVQTDLKVVYDLSTFDNTEQIRLDIDALKQDKQINIPHYNTLKDCDISFTRRFCKDTKSKWTARINSLRMLDKHDDSDKTTKINLSDLLELLYIRYKHSLPESLLVYDKSVTVEQKKLMESFIPKVQQNLLNLYSSYMSTPLNLQSKSWWRVSRSVVTYLKQSIEESISKTIQPFIDIFLSDMCEDPVHIINALFYAMVKDGTPYTFFSETFRHSKAIRKYVEFQDTKYRGGTSVLAKKRRGGSAGLIVIIALLACCGFMKFIIYKDQSSGSSSRSSSIDQHYAKYYSQVNNADSS